MIKKQIKEEEKGVDSSTLERILNKALSKNNNKVIFERLAEI